MFILDTAHLYILTQTWLFWLVWRTPKSSSQTTMMMGVLLARMWDYLRCINVEQQDK